MGTPTPEAAAAEANERSLRIWGGISYLLHLLVALGAVIPGAQVSIAVLIIALVMDLAKKDDAAGTWHASHFAWRISSVLWAGALYVVTIPAFFLGLFLFNPAWVLISGWFLWRIVKGMIRMNQNKEIH
ncbi:MAG: hypothetical protein J6T92_07880 [Ottowia sp.]|nr:hypothetical protein [Ottowia sp.]